MDLLRRDRTYATQLAVLQAEADREGPAVPIEDGDDVPDERLRLFTCCHPALPLEEQTALTPALPGRPRHAGSLGVVEFAVEVDLPDDAVQQPAREAARDRRPVPGARAQLQDRHGGWGGGRRGTPGAAGASGEQSG